MSLCIVLTLTLVACAGREVVRARVAGVERPFPLGVQVDRVDEGEDGSRVELVEQARDPAVGLVVDPAVDVVQGRAREGGLVQPRAVPPLDRVEIGLSHVEARIEEDRVVDLEPVAVADVGERGDDPVVCRLAVLRQADHVVDLVPARASCALAQHRERDRQAGRAEDLVAPTAGLGGEMGGQVMAEATEPLDRVGQVCGVVGSLLRDLGLQHRATVGARVRSVVGRLSCRTP